MASTRATCKPHQYPGSVAGVALGHRRLSIIDVAGGKQPLANEDESVWIVFNGEIFNYRDLHRRLEGSGHHFRTASDTETLVHLYEDEGVGFLAHIEGMFALAIWDAHADNSCSPAIAWARSRWCIARSQGGCSLPAN